MGSSPSKSLSANSSASSSQSLAGDGHRSSRTRHRTTTSTLNVPGSSSHRRSRSANPMSDNTSLAPPPPYSEAIGTSPPARPTDPPVRRSRSAQGLPYQANNSSENIGRTTTATSTTPSTGSRHTKVFTISEGQNIPRTAEYLQAPMQRESIENALETLRKYDTVIVVDDSSSMRGKRWKDTKEALSSLADVTAKYDADGIDVYFLNDKRSISNVRKSSAVKQLFADVQPKGITPIGEKLEELLLSYLDKIENAKAREAAGKANAKKDIKPVNFIVLTDGAPTDDPEDVIVTTARRLDRGNFPITQVGIQFVQIGDSPRAAEFLQELDDSLSSNHGIRDMVDTTPFTLTEGKLTAEMLTKILLGGINRRVDRRGGGSVMP